MRSLIRENECGSASTGQADRKIAPPHFLELIGKSAPLEQCRRIPSFSMTGSALSHDEILNTCRSYPVGFPLLQSADWREQGRLLPADANEESAVCVQLNTPIGDGKINVYYSASIVIAGKDTALGVALVEDWTASNPRPRKKTKKSKGTSA